MNKRTVTFLGGTVGAILALSACGGSTYQYGVSGQVLSQQVDIECPKTNLSMEAVSFDTGKHKAKTGSGHKSSSKSKASKEPKAEKSKKASKSKGSKSTSPKTSPTTTATKRPTQKSVRNVGVSLSKKPEKPEKLKGLGVPHQKNPKFRKGCEREYEIFILSGGHLYEQDVRKVDYNNCQRAWAPKGQIYKLFPLCTKG